MFDRFKNYKTKFSNFWQRMSDDRRGITTSEFWLSLGTVLSTTAGCLFGVLKPLPAGILTTAVVIGYTLSRGIAKRKPKDDDDYNDDHGGDPYERRAWEKHKQRK